MRFEGTREFGALDGVFWKPALEAGEAFGRGLLGNLRGAARSLGTTHSTLSRILKKHKERSLGIQAQPAHTSAYSIAA